MQRVLTTRSEHHQRFGYIRPTDKRRFHDLQYRSSLPVVVNDPHPSPPPLKSLLPQKKKQELHRVALYDDIQVFKFTLFDIERQIGYIPSMVVQTADNALIQPNWDLIKKMNNLPTRQRSPGNAILITEWINGVEYQYPLTYFTTSSGEKRPVNHQFMYVFKELLHKSRKDALERIELKMRGIIEMAITKYYLKDLLTTVSKHVIIVDLERRTNLFDIIRDYTDMLTKGYDNVEERTLVIIKEGLINYWIQSYDQKCMENWDLLLLKLVREVSQDEVNAISTIAEALMQEMRQAKSKVWAPPGDDNGDHLENWNSFIRVKHELLDLKKRKEYLLTLLCIYRRS